MASKKFLWKKVISGGDFDSYKDPIISKSWKRSSNYGINPLSENNKE